MPLRTKSINQSTDPVTGDNKVSSWLNLTEVLLVQLMIFNRRRCGEISKMTLSMYEAGKNVVDRARPAICHFRKEE